MEVDVNGEARSTLSTLPLPVAEVSSPGKAEAEKPRCSSTPCSPMRRTVSGYQILHMDSNYLVGFTTGEELLKLAQKCTGGEESKGEAVPSLRSKQLDAGLARSSRLYKTRSRYYQPYEIPAVNGRRRRRMPSSGDKCTKSLPYEPYKALHGPLPLCLLKDHILLNLRVAMVNFMCQLNWIMECPSYLAEHDFKTGPTSSWMLLGELGKQSTSCFSGLQSGNGTTPIGSPGTSACRSKVVGLLSLPNHMLCFLQFQGRTFHQQKRLQLALLRCLLYCGGLEPNPQYL
ncbi:macrophage immunometabolism regulator isoform X7 [Myotis myotis]|uniref:macrophage immunometabolism regulator isoform X7 n=1 Tax=Myotis myotis TaxID=51298 RepID=UPI001748E854|nr:macrophage immunometabolism regulator isoform X7 [Myotis myotis]